MWYTLQEKSKNTWDYKWLQYDLNADIEAIWLNGNLLNKQLKFKLIFRENSKAQQFKENFSHFQQYNLAAQNDIQGYLSSKNNNIFILRCLRIKLRLYPLICQVMKLIAEFDFKTHDIISDVLEPIRSSLSLPGETIYTALVHSSNSHLFFSATTGQDSPSESSPDIDLPFNICIDPGKPF